MTSPARERVLAVALGEASADLVLDWAAKGELPTLQRLMQDGVSGRISCPQPFITPQMWGTVLTGTNPGRHGLFDFWQRGPDGRFHEIVGADLKAPPVWRHVNAAGLRCGIVNVPLTYPPQRIDGFMLAGQDAPGPHRSIAEPRELYDELIARFGRYPLKEIFPGGRQKADYLTLFDRDTREWGAILEALAARDDWDFLLTFSSASAMAQHYFWADMASDDPDNPYRPLIKRVFVALDSVIGRMIEAAGPGTRVFVVSECGAGPLRSGVEINNWLEQEGFLAYASPPGAEGGLSQRSLFADLRHLIQARLPTAVQTELNRRLRPLKTWLQSRTDMSGIEWARTQAYSRGKEGEIFVNLQGREPHGSVEPGHAYERTRDRLIERLLALRDPATGEPAVSAVHRGEAYYHGPFTSHAPDLVVCWRNGEYMPSERKHRGREVFVERWRQSMRWPTSGSHREHGIFFAAGPGIRRGAVLDGGGIIDLAPTWLAALGIAPPVELEGRPLAQIFDRPLAEPVASAFETA